MAELDDKVIVTKSKITDIADALREEMSESNEYSLPTMVQKVHELGQGQGSEYTGGVGIDITNRVVSVVDTLMIRGSANGSVASFDDGGNDMPLKSCIVAIEPVQSGSGDPSPQNERPISGWTGCNLTRDGKNFIPYPYTTPAGTYGGAEISYDGDKIILNDEATTNTLQAMSRVPLKAGTYKFSGIQTSTRTRIQLYKNNNLLISLDNDDNPYTFTVVDGDVIDFKLQILTATYNNDSVVAMIELGSTATTYEPYKGNIYNIEFPSQAGTVYGGTLDVTNGVLIDGKIMFNAEDWTNFAVSSQTTDAVTFSISLPSEVSLSSNFAISNRFSTNIPSGQLGRMVIVTLDNIKVLYFSIAKSELSTYDSAGAEEWFDSHHTQFLFDAETPQTYQLTPTQVKTLLGINNIFADCGDVDVEYVRDATLIINKLLELAFGNNNRTMMKSAVVEKTDEVQEQKKDSVEEDLDA
jgi:hypothetical protein